MAKRPAGHCGSAACPCAPFSESLPMALLRTREAVMRLFRPGLRSHGVTEQQWRILRALAHAGPMEVTELAEATFLLAPSLSRILPDLEKRAAHRAASGGLATCAAASSASRPRGCGSSRRMRQTRKRSTARSHGDSGWSAPGSCCYCCRSWKPHSRHSRTRRSPPPESGGPRRESLLHAEAAFQLNRDPAMRRRFEQDLEALLADYELDEEERRALREPDIGLLYVMGVNGQILMHFAALRGLNGMHTSRRCAKASVNTARCGPGSIHGRMPDELWHGLASAATLMSLVFAGVCSHAPGITGRKRARRSGGSRCLLCRARSHATGARGRQARTRSSSSARSTSPTSS